MTRRQVSESAVSWPLTATPKISVFEHFEMSSSANGHAPQPYHGSSLHKFQDSWLDSPPHLGAMKEKEANEIA